MPPCHPTYTDSPLGVINICFGDIDCNGQVDDDDFVLFANAYNIYDCNDNTMPNNCAADINGDGAVDDTDFAYFATAYDNFACP